MPRQEVASLKSAPVDNARMSAQRLAIAFDGVEMARFSASMRSCVAEMFSFLVIERLGDFER